MADGGRGVPVAAEVAAFERHVSCDDDLVTAGRGNDGAVVADTEAEGAGAAGSDGSALANALDPCKLPLREPCKLPHRWPGELPLRDRGRRLRGSAGRGRLGGHRESDLKSLRGC